MSLHIDHLTTKGRLLRFANPPGLYPVNAYQSLVLATASELVAHILAAQTQRKLSDLTAWEPCCGGGPVAVSLKSLGLKYVQASDVNEDALASCAQNAAANNLQLDKVTHAELLDDGTGGLFDLICCNPPCGVEAVVAGTKSPGIRRAVDGGGDGMSQTVEIIEQSTRHLSKDGSLVLIAVSTGSAARLIRALDQFYPKSWRVMPSTPVAAPWFRETDERAIPLLSQPQTFEPFLWRRGDGWIWRLSWVIEASKRVKAFPETRGLPVRPYGYNVENDPQLASLIARVSDDSFWLTTD